MPTAPHFVDARNRWDSDLVMVPAGELSEQPCESRQKSHRGRHVPALQAQQLRFGVLILDQEYGCRSAAAERQLHGERHRSREQPTAGIERQVPIAVVVDIRGQCLLEKTRGTESEVGRRLGMADAGHRLRRDGSNELAHFVVHLMGRRDRVCNFEPQNGAETLTQTMDSDLHGRLAQPELRRGLAV